MLLRDLLGTWAGREQKHDRIREVLDLHPDLPFVLLGDSGEHDPQIYADIVRDPVAVVGTIYERFGIEWNPEKEAYFRRFPDYPRGITVPAVVEVASAAVVRPATVRLRLPPRQPRPLLPRQQKEPLLRRQKEDRLKCLSRVV